MHDETLKDTLRERFETYTSTPSEEVWHGIEAALDEDDRGAGWAWWTTSGGIITITAILTATAAVFFFIPIINTTGSTFPLTDKGKTTVNEAEPRNFMISSGDDQMPEKTTQPVFHASAPHEVILPEPAVSQPIIAERTEKSEISNLETNPVSPLQHTGCQYNPEFTELNQPFFGHHGWRIDIIASSFVNLDRNQKNQLITESISTDLPPPTGPSQAVIKTSHQRYVELGIGLRRHFFNRMEFGFGLAGSYSQQKVLVDQEEYSRTSQWSIGIPISVAYNFNIGSRFTLGGVLRWQHELNLRKQQFTDQNTPPPTPNSLADLQVQSVSKSQGYRMGIEPALEASFLLSPRITLNTSVGYRTYVIERFNHTLDFQQKNYLNLGLGISYRL